MWYIIWILGTLLACAIAVIVTLFIERTKITNNKNINSSNKEE